MRKIRFLMMLLFVAYAGHLAAQESEGILNRLLAPGPLIEGHEDLEQTRCLECHDAGRGLSDTKCMICHKEIKTFVELKRGFHGLRKESCFQCHADHKGRTASTTVVDEKSFDHLTTGFSLEGKHSSLKCSECHTKKRTTKRLRKNETHFFGKQTSCVSCHKKDDVHFFKAPWKSKDCNACHGPTSWKKDISFDHEKDGKYRLLGKHDDIKCSKCHVPNPKTSQSKYKWPSLEANKCLSCHANFHKDNVSPKYRSGRCDQCHSQSGWKIDDFDHSTVGYELRGKHAVIRCTECHKPRPGASTPSLKTFKWSGLNQNCTSCHKDYHAFGKHSSAQIKRPNDCMTCHNEKSWSDIHAFDHDVNTRYKIDGEHLKAKCNECHLPKKGSGGRSVQALGIYQWPNLLTKTCENCHKSPHTKVFSAEMQKKRCTECHSTTGWKAGADKKSFDHGKTRFLLTGAHLKLRCNECHVKQKAQVFKFSNVDLKFCIDCHSNVHKGQFSAKFASQSCAECHGTTRWTERLPFDHSLTTFALKGEHEKLKCSECHKPTNQPFGGKIKTLKAKFLYPDLSAKDCQTCHADFHNKQLGNKCSACHNEKSWRPSQFDHSTQSQFVLRGKHEKLKCEECHKPVSGQFVEWKKKRFQVIGYKPVGQACIDCHRDPHKGKLGNRCQDCHGERDWRATRDFHKNFALTGVHYTLGCEECHKDKRKLVGMSGDCVVCHQKDDVHSGTLPKCGECHRQQFWENSSWKHSLAGFPLRGVHRTLECIECHNQGVYRGTPSACVSCHLQDALSV
ncbi:MAG: cytochrome c3 family protein, partial [Bdellovibrionia bacterium]